MHLDALAYRKLGQLLGPIYRQGRGGNGLPQGQMPNSSSAI